MNFKEIKPVNLKEINAEYSLEGLMLKLKLQYFGHLMRETDSFELTQMLRKIEGRSEWNSRRPVLECLKVAFLSPSQWKVAVNTAGGGGLDVPSFIRQLGCTL